MLPTFCVTVSQNFSQIDISVIEINSVLGIGVSLSILYIIYIERESNISGKKVTDWWRFNCTENIPFKKKMSRNAN